ncbi:MAG: hypothetical protein QM795_03685 [Pseudoxanthomonas sp.]
MAPTSTPRPLAKHVLWLAALICLLILSLYKFLTTLDAEPSPGPFFLITTCALFLTCIRATVRVALILRERART